MKIKTTTKPLSVQQLARLSQRSNRPLHKKLLLHPVSILLVLCTGVVLAASTLQSMAGSFDLTATVPAPLPHTAATITSHYDQQHTPSSLISVVGSCPDNSYVKLSHNGFVSAIAWCTNSTFHAQTSLTAGANQLQAKVYNITDNEGPSSPAITIYYDTTSVAVQTPASPPNELTLTTLDATRFTLGASHQTSSRPTLSGYAPPFSNITVTFHSEIKTCKTTANSSGWWLCTLDSDLPEGAHSVDIVAATPGGQILSLPTAHIIVKTTTPNLLLKLVSTSPLVLTTDYRYQTHRQGELWSWNIAINGGTPPYKLSINWDDGDRTDISRDNGESLTMSHTFRDATTYQPVIRAVDRQGTVAILQLLATVKGTSTGALTAKPNILQDLRQYLWLIWPAYIIVLLMVASFWLGEREAVQQLAKRRLRRHS